MCPIRAAQPSKRPRAITVVLARFDDLFAGGLRDLIDGDHSLEIVATDVEHGRLPVVLRAHRPAVAILDLGAVAKLVEVRELVERNPGTHLVLLATEPSMVECVQLLAFGASACLGRDTQSRDVLSAIHLASRGLQVMPRATSVEDGVGVRRALLTPRQAEVLPLLQLGRTNAQIAAELVVGVETVRTHARNIYRKLGVSSRRELAAAAGGDRRGPVAAAHAARRRPLSSLPRARRGHGASHE